MAPANEPVNIHFVDDEIREIFQALKRFLDDTAFNSKADEKKDDENKWEIISNIFIFIIFVLVFAVLVILLIFVYKYCKNEKKKALLGNPRQQEELEIHSPPHILREPQTMVLTPTISHQIPPVNNHNNSIPTIMDSENANNSDQVPKMKKKKIVYVSKTVDCQTKFPTWKKQQPLEKYDSYV